MTRRPIARAPLVTRNILAEQALDEAVALMKKTGFLNFTLTWNPGKGQLVQAYPHTRETVRGSAEEVLDNLRKLMP
jgi:hypothetical protein